VHPHASTPVTPLDSIHASFARIPRKLIPVIAGVAAGLLAFTIGAAAIVVNTSPRLLTRRAFEQQMAVGRKCYREGQYREAAEAFRQAQQLSPSSLEAMNRLNDAERMAGPVRGQPPSAPLADETQIAAATQSATPGFSAFRPTWIGPPPGGATPSSTTAAPATAPPPYIPSPTHAGTSTRPELPPLPPSSPVSTQPFEGFEGPSRRSPDAESPSGTPGSETPGAKAEDTQTKPPLSGFTMTWGPPRKPPSATPVQPRTPPVSPADETRRAADRLQQAGQYGEAATQYAQAEALYRGEAGQGGPNRAAKAAAADSCRDARKLCESLAH
jgi:tetratricopeptide (TPR) repeat protein